MKIWDRDTMTLQASLHGHEDVITDIDISRCNKYLATGSKDGCVLIWDFEKCSIVDKINTHSHAVSNLKFFEFKIGGGSEAGPSAIKSGGGEAKDILKVLVTCSEDGSVIIYDESGFLFNKKSSEEGGSQQ